MYFPNERPGLILIGCFDHLVIIGLDGGVHEEAHARLVVRDDHLLQDLWPWNQGLVPQAFAKSWLQGFSTASTALRNSHGQRFTGSRPLGGSSQPWSDKRLGPGLFLTAALQATEGGGIIGAVHVAQAEPAKCQPGGFSGVAFDKIAGTDTMVTRG